MTRLEQIGNMSASEEGVVRREITAIAATATRSYSSSTNATLGMFPLMDDDGQDPEPATRAVLIGFGLGALVALPAIFLALMSAGAGHGDYVLARALFPAPMLLTLVEGSIGQLAMTVGLLQFPAYGALLAWANVRDKYLPVILAASAHLAAAAACFSGALPNFS